MKNSLYSGRMTQNHKTIQNLLWFCWRIFEVAAPSKEIFHQDISAENGNFVGTPSIFIFLHQFSLKKVRSVLCKLWWECLESGEPSSAKPTFHLPFIFFLNVIEKTPKKVFVDS